MSSENGQPVIRIGRKGKRLFAFGDGKPFEVDVVATHSLWVEIDRQFRNAEGKVPPDRLLEANKAAWQFVIDNSGAADLTLAEALEFLKEISEETKRLSDFFVLKSSDEPSSRENTAVRFST